MRKALVGILVAVLIIGAGAYFGSKLSAQFQTKNEVEAVFDSLRTTFTTAAHGKIELDAGSRTLKISDIVLQSEDKATTIMVGQILVVGGTGPAGDRIGADRIEISNWELSTSLPISSGPRISYKAPTITIEAYSGPATMPRKVVTASMIEVMRSSLEYFAASKVSTISIPKLSATVTPRQSTEPSPALGPIEYTYYDLMLRDILEGHVGSITIARTTFTSDSAIPEVGSFAGAMALFTITDFNIGTALAMFDPSNAQNDNYMQMYKQATSGPLELRFAKGSGLQVDGFTADDIGVRPSKLSIFSFLSMADSAPPPGTPPTPEQMRAIFEQVANMYEGVRIGKSEMRGMKVNMPPDGVFKIGALRMTGLENGRLAEFALEGVEGQSPQKDPVRIGLFALKGLQLANLVRQSAQMADAGRSPSPAQAIGMLSLLEGIELNDVNAKNGQQTIRVDTFRLSWGQFVGPVPTTAHLTTKTTVPTNLADPGMGSMLSDAGMANLTTKVDIGVAWTEPNLTLTISPVDIEIENAFSFSANLTILNAPRSMFSSDPGIAMAAADQLEAGPLKLSLRDTGGLKTALAQYAKSMGVSVDDARKEIIESVNQIAKSSAQANPDTVAIAQALVQFIETPGSTLTISVTPKGRVNFKQAFGAASADPAATTSLFTIEAKTTQ